MAFQSIVCCAIFVAVNIGLWTLDISDEQLLWATAPLSLAYFPGVVWLYSRQSRKTKKSR